MRLTVPGGLKSMQRSIGGAPVASAMNQQATHVLYWTRVPY